MKLNSLNSPDLPILIVDDNVQYVQVLTRMLQQGFGYKNITAVHSIEEGYTLLSSDPSRFALLFVDYWFPSGQTGGELLKRLREEKLLEDKVAFLITSEPSVDNVREARVVGAQGVVAKPFDREQLKTSLQRAESALTADDNSF